MTQLKICVSVYLIILWVKQFSLSLTLKEILQQEKSSLEKEYHEQINVPVKSRGTLKVYPQANCRWDEKTAQLAPLSRCTIELFQSLPMSEIQAYDE